MKRIKINGAELDMEKLKSRQELMAYFNENAPTHSALMDFCEEYRDGEMYFTYTLQEGVAKTTNGEFLLKKVGIL